MSFQQSLHVGQTGESWIARYLQSRGWNVLPVYEKLIDDGKGPRVFTAESPLIAPDMLVFNGEQAHWVEAKHKTAFTWHRITSRWVTGIDQQHFDHYCEIASSSPWPVWLLFLHRGGQAKDSPSASPDGLWGGLVDDLKNNYNHKHGNWGRTGMIYWARAEDGGALECLATMEQLRPFEPFGAIQRVPLVPRGA